MVFIRRPSLPSRSAVEPRRLPGALGDHGLQQLHHRGAVPFGAVGRCFRAGIERRRLGADRAYGVRLDRFGVGRDRVHRARHLHQRHLGRAEREAWHRRQLRMHPKALRHVDHALDADRLDELRRHRIERLGEGAAQRDRAVIAPIVILRLPVADLDWLVHHHAVRAVAVAQRGQVDKDLEQRAGLAVRLRRAVELAFVVVAPTDHRQDRAVGGHRDERRLADVTARAFAVEPVLHDALCGLLQLGVEGRRHRQVERRGADEAFHLGLGRIDEIIVARLGVGRQREPHRLGPCRRGTGLVDRALAHHRLQHQLGTAARRLGVAARRKLRGGTQKAGQRRRLCEAEFARLLAEIALGRRIGAERAGAEIDRVQIPREDLVLRQPGVEPHRDHRLLHLAPQRAFRREVGQPDQLLGDRAAAFDRAAAAQIMPAGPHDAAQVDPVMTEKAPVLDRDDGMDEIGRQVVAGQLLAAVHAARRQGLPGARRVEDRRRRCFVGERPRQRQRVGAIADKRDTGDTEGDNRHQGNHRPPGRLEDRHSRSVPPVAVTAAAVPVGGTN